MPRASFARRSFLQAVAAGAVTLPFVRMLRAGGAVTPPKRLVVFMQNNGTQQGSFWPASSTSLSSPILDSLFKDAVTNADNGLMAKTSIVKGVYVPADANGTDGNEHDMFTGQKLISVGGQPWGGGPSVDQIIAKSLGVDTLTLAVLASEVEPHPKVGFDHRESFSYLDTATIKHPRVDPRSVYDYLFPPTNVAAGRRLTVLDAVSANIAEVEGRLGTTEKAKLDMHLTAIRDVEQRLRASAPSCMVPPSPPDYLLIDPSSEVSEDTYITAMVENMIDLAVVALDCGVTPITTIQFGYGGGKWRFAWKGIDMNCHDDVAHLDTSDAGSSPINTQRVVLMNQYYASCVARLATALDALPEGNGTMLDNTLVVWANEFGRGDHSLSNVPIVFIGGGSGGLPPGGRVVDMGPQVFNRLGCTLLNLFGLNVAGFGDVSDCGVFQGLL
jgi:hypothetical protein